MEDACRRRRRECIWKKEFMIMNKQTCQKNEILFDFYFYGKRASADNLCKVHFIADCGSYSPVERLSTKTLR